MKLSKIPTATVVQIYVIEIVPDPLVRIEVRRVSGQLSQMETLGRAALQGIIDELPAMDGRAIPDEDDPAPHMHSNTRRKLTTVAPS
jgi:hypothetical protein